MYTETIGLSTKKSEVAASNYQYQFMDIVIPSIIDNHNPVYYFLFHMPPVYNWLRTVQTKERNLLMDYIDRGNKKNKADINKLGFNKKLFV
jgi:hypothetical protein